jgi:hypothetical protein
VLEAETASRIDALDPRTVLVHLAITNLAACVALLLPVNATIAASAGVNPLVTGLIITMVVDAVILYPVQTASNLMAYESGYFGRADVRNLGWHADADDLGCPSGPALLGPAGAAARLALKHAPPTGTAQRA